MAKATIALPDGTKVEFTGTPEELNHFLKTRSEKRGDKNNKKIINGPAQRIRDLIAENYFIEKRTSSEILSKLSEKGHFYKSEGITTPLRRLCKNGEIRRFKENNKLVYMNP